MARWLKISLVILVSLMLLSVVVVPPLARSYLQRTSREWLGRRLTIESASFNVFTGSLTLNGFRLYEKSDTAVFVEVDKIFVNPAILKMLTSSYQIDELTVTGPRVMISQHGEHFNFDDLVDRFASSDTTTRSPEPVAEPIKYFLFNLTLANGTLVYRNLDLSAEVGIEKINVTCPAIRWDDPREHYDFSIAFTKGGKAVGTFDLDIESLAYATNYQLDSLNLALLLPYVKDYMQAGNFDGHFTSHQRLSGNLNTPQEIITTGELKLNGFALTDPDQGNLVTADELHVVIDSLNVAAELYNFQQLRLTNPYLKFELLEQGNNFSKLLNDTTSASAGPSSDSLATAVAYGNVFALMAAYIREASQHYAFSNYRADSLVLRGGKLVFNDYTLHSKFNYVLEDLMIKAERVSSADEDIVFKASSILNTSGRLNGEISIDPKGFRDMDIHYTIRDLLVSDFNPYSNYWVAHPFTDGVCYYTSSSSVRDRYLKSDHQLEIRTIKVGDKVKNKTAYNLPIKLAVALLRDKNGNVKIDLPIEGNLDDPKYKIGRVIWQVFKNLLSKAVAAPGKLLAGKAGVDEKLVAGFDWGLLQTDLDDQQKKSLDAMVASLATTPEVNLELVKVYNFQREMDELALRESKKRFLFFQKRIKTEEAATPEDAAAVDELAPRDSAFMAFVEQQSQTGGSLLSIFDKSRRVVGNERLQAKLNELLELRRQSVEQYLFQVKMADRGRIRVVDPKEAKDVPYETWSRMVANFYLGGEE